MTNVPVKAKPEKRRSYFPLLVLAGVSFAIFWRAQGHEFLINWDDPDYVTRNTIIRGITFEHLKAAFTNFYMGNYAPLHLASYMLDYQIWGLRFSGFLFTNIVLHSANGLLYYLLLRRLSGDKVWIFFAALIFLLHPVQVESVVWISERKNLLAMFFFLLGVISYVNYTEGSRKHSRTSYYISLLFFILALLSKPAAIIFPLVITLFDLCFGKERDLRRLFADKVPFVLIAIIFGIVALKSQSHAFQGGRTSYHGGSPASTLFTMLPVLLDYFRMIAWPANLSVWYNPPIKTHIDAEVVLAFSVCAALFIAAVKIYRWRPRMFFWFTLFFAGLIPVSQIVPIVTLMNDRYLYFPLLGAAAFIGVIIFRDMAWTELKASKKGIVLAAVCLIVVAAYSAETLRRIDVWRNSFTLWSDAVIKAPALALPHDLFGEALLDMGKLDEAIEQFMLALSLEPGHAAIDNQANRDYEFFRTHNNLGVAYGRKGLTDNAINQFLTAIRLKPDYAKAYENLGSAYMHAGSTEEALRCFETAVRLKPGDDAFRANLKRAREGVDSGSAWKRPAATE